MIDTVADKVKRVEKLHSALQQEKAGWNATYEEIKKFILPEIGDPYGNKNSNGGVEIELLDSTACLANDLLATQIHNTLTSPVMPWFQLSLAEKKYLDYKEVQEWLQECTRALYNKFYESNFNRSIQQIWLMLTSSGTAVLQFNDLNHLGDFNFKAIPPTQVCLMENAFEIVDTLFWTFTYTSKQIAERWPDSVKHIEILKDVNDKPDKKHEVVHYCAPKGNFKTLNKDHEFVSIYYLKNGGQPLNNDGDSFKGFHECPYMVPRYKIAPGEVFGRGPGQVCLPDIKTLNRIIQMKLQGAELKILPPFTNENGTVSLGKDRKIKPGRVYPKKMMGKFEAIQCGADIQIAEFQIDEYRKRIKEAFHYDALLMYPDKNYKTAYEVQSQENNVLRMLGPAMARFKTELLDQVIERGFNIMLRNKQFPEAPSVLSGKDMNVEYIGPLARAQKMHEVRAIENLYATIASLAQFNPTIIHKIKDSDSVDRIAELIGAPLDLLRDGKEYEKIATEIQKKQVDMANMQTMREGAQGLQAIARSKSAMEG